MLNYTKHIAARPEADTETVEDMVARARRGLVRIPAFQRGLRWGAVEVVQLFDSIYKGYPIGSFLLRKGKAEAARVEMGPLKIDAPETHEALWVIDGQQRLTALTAGLSRPTPVPNTPEDAFIVYFDAVNETFHSPPKDGKISDSWVPVADLLDASGLSEWVFHWKHGRDPSLRTTVFEAGSRIRQYRIPLYVVDTDDEYLLRDIFYRTNNYGKSLEWEDVHDALFGHRGDCPSTLHDLASELLLVGMGRPTEKVLLSCLVAYQGLDVTRNVAEHYRRDREFLQNVVRDALPAIRRVMSFLRLEAEIPHLRLLPRSLPMVILTRFFRLFPEPNFRTLKLLSRWTWRSLLGTALFDERTLLRRGVSVIKADDAEGSAQELLTLVPRTLPTELEFSLPKRFDARATESRLALLGMASLGPLDLRTTEPLDIAALIDGRSIASFRSVIPENDLLGHSPANRILLPGKGHARTELFEAAAKYDADKVFHSHGISGSAINALLNGNPDVFLRERAVIIEHIVREMSNRLAGWSLSDRPSMSYILEQTEHIP